MIFKDELEVIQKIKDSAKVKSWVNKARENHKVLSALVTGKDFDSVLVNRIEHLESSQKAIARKKYSKDIRDLFHRVYQPRINVFSAAGGSVNNEFKSETNLKRFLESIKDYKGQKSLKQYLSEEYFLLSDIDPNGLIFTEYKSDKDIYPTYKSINDIRDYSSNGQLLGYVIFEPVQISSKGQVYQEWRVVDDKKDYRIKQVGNDFQLIEDKTFDHPFGIVPAIVLGNKIKTGTEIRISNIYPVTELAKDYARDKSVLTIYKFQHGFPSHWRYEKECKSCHGTGKDGDGNACGTCDGIGFLVSKDVTDVNLIALPREDDQLVTPNIEGFVSPDLATWVRYDEVLRESEDKIDATVWGTKRITNATNETATGRFIDVQPVMNRLAEYSDNVEWVHNKLGEFVQSWIDGQPIKESKYYYGYGDRFIIESQDVITERYSKSRREGDNVTILDKQLDEVLLVKYQNNPKQLEIAQKKRQVEPYVHNAIIDVFTMFGASEADKKVKFVDFWEQVDTSKEVDVLKKEFNDYAAEPTEESILDDIQKTRDSLNKMSPLLATAVIKEMGSEEIRKLVGLKGNKIVEKVEPINTIKDE